MKATKNKKIYKFIYIFMFIVIFFISSTIKVNANMAAPRVESISTNISFEKNNDISVTKEIIDIKIETPNVKYKVIYYMKNLKDEVITTPSMFVSPSFYNESIKVYQDNEELSYIQKNYSLNYNTEIKKDSWKYVLEEVTEDINYDTISTITFDLKFNPLEESVITLEYDNKLGGYPDYDFDVKDGTLTYYLTPAALWSGFNDLTINLTLDSELDYIDVSTLEFEKVSKYKYTYHSDKLPEEDLEMRIRPNNFKRFILKFKSPYFNASIFLLIPLIIIIIIVVITVGVVLYKIKKKRKI